MQIAIRRASTILASVMTMAIAGVIGTGAVAGNEGVDQQDLIGKKAPDFTLVDLEGNEHKLSDYTKEGKTVVLEWFNPGCPFVVKHYGHENDTMDSLSKEYEEQDVVWLAINSANSGDKSGEVDTNKTAHKNWEMNHPILRDTDGKVGQAYGAVTTPNMYVIDKEGVLRYAGAIDSDRRANKMGETNYVKDALNAVLAGETVETTYAKPYGCNVKY